MNGSNLPGYGDPQTWPTHAREYLDDVPFEESRVYQDWLAESADSIAHGDNVTWTVRRGFGLSRDGVMFDDVMEYLADEDEYIRLCDKLAVARLKGDEASGAMDDIRALIRAEAMDRLADKADSYAEYLRQQAEEDKVEARA